jgi:cytochrome P450
VAPATRVSVHHYATYRSGANFADPDVFAPERWLQDGRRGEEGERYVGDRREALQPFAYGPRNCLGQNMAMHEMRLLLARLYWRFDLRLAAPGEKWNEQRAFVLWEKRPLLCRVGVAEGKKGT